MDLQNIKLEDKETQRANCKEMAKLAETVHGKPCNQCYELGQLGWIEKEGYYIICDCVLDAAKKIRKEKRKQVPHEPLPEENN